jgi:hypothetical protein
MREARSASLRASSFPSDTVSWPTTSRLINGVIVTTIANTNDGSTRLPRLRPVMNMGNLDDLPAYSTGPRGKGAELYAAIRDAGYEAVQGGDPELARQAGLDYFAGGRVNAPEEVDARARHWRDRGALAATVHVAWGFEADEEMDRLTHAVIETSARRGLPVYIETHRATITQDIWRTVQLVHRIPEIRFNGDFSHWYTGHEMTYGDFAAKLDFCQPVFERVRFMHGRIGDSSNMQVDIGDGEGDHVEHFRDMWTRCMAGFLASARPGDYLAFAPELLPPGTRYARLVRAADGTLTEDSDRWQQAGVLLRIARECFEQARQEVAVGQSA